MMKSTNPIVDQMGVIEWLKDFWWSHVLADLEVSH